MYKDGMLLQDESQESLKVMIVYFLEITSEKGSYLYATKSKTMVFEGEEGSLSDVFVRGSKLH